MSATMIPGHQPNCRRHQCRLGRNSPPSATLPGVITGKNLRDVALALQDRAVEFVRILPALDRYSSVAGKEAVVKTIEIEDKKEQG